MSLGLPLSVLGLYCSAREDQLGPAMRAMELVLHSRHVRQAPLGPLDLMGGWLANTDLVICIATMAARSARASAHALVSMHS